MEDFMNVAVIPLLVAVCTAYYAVRLMLTRDASVILGKEKGILKDEANYTKGASVLLGFLALSSVAMGALLFYNANIALIQFLTCLVIFMILWARMNQKYGKK